MWTRNIALFLTVLLIHSVVCQQKPKKKPNEGVLNLDCPLDDDPDNPTQLPVPGDCTKFLKCSYGKAYTLSCPRGLHWSIELNRCEAQKVANCDPNATTPRPEIGGGGCTFSFKPHPTDCDKAIQCAGGKDIVIQCMEDMYWNQDKMSCDFDDSHC